jgi:hypothetical protein
LAFTQIGAPFLPRNAQFSRVIQSPLLFRFHVYNGRLLAR